VTPRAGRRGGRVLGVLRAVFANPDLRRQQLAFAGFNAAEWGVWIALLVYAYDHGGATAAGLVALVQLVPSGLCAPFAAGLADRYPPALVLRLGYVAQAAAMAATAAALTASAPPGVAYALAAVAACATTITRPAQAVLVPSLVRTMDELTATNVVSGWTESVSLLVAPALAGALLAFSGPGLVFAVMAAATAISAALMIPVKGPPGTVTHAAAQGGSLARAAAGFKVAAADPAARVILLVLGTQFLLIGALDVLFVVLAVDVLDLGGSGAGYLNAAFGAGGVLGIAATVSLVGRSRLAPPLAGAAAAWTLALLVLGLWPTVVGAFLLLALAGAARGLLDVAARTLLQRTARNDVLARVFGLLETLDSIGLALGAVLAPALVALLGAQAAIAGLALVLPILFLVSNRQIASIDSHATVPVVEVALLRSLPIFQPLGAPTLEGLARKLTPIELGAGEKVIRQGAPGERYYVIADGSLEITRDSVPIATVGRGAGVGEISLLAGVPCTATVTASTVAHLYAIEAAPFVEVVGQHPASADTAMRMLRERMPSGTASRA
jgi:hypothetical protein